MNKKHAVILMLMILIVIVAAISYIHNSHNNPSTDNEYQDLGESSLLKECPEEWITNRMPNIEGEKAEEDYFIFNGERKEIKNYDLEWIKSNCAVKPQNVY